jgi:hypothetical protein
MKISIGINGFKNYETLEKREKFCIDALLKIKQDNVTLYNICFDNENIEYKNFTTLNKLTKKSNKLIHEYFQHEGLTNEYNLRKQEIDNNNKELPTVKEIFDVLASTDCDYFLFLNNDIILSNRIFKEIEDGIECYPISRMHIFDIENLNDTPKLESYSVHGFDAFLVKKETWLKIRNNFEDLILGRFYWDTYFATMFNLLCKCKNINKLPPACFHIEHNSNSSDNTIENYYNEDVFKRNMIIGHLWFSYVQNILLKRPTVNNCKWYQPFPNELELEKQHFDQLNQIQLVNPNFQKQQVTEKQDFDLFIPVAPKDEIKLPYVIEYANKHLKHKKIFVCSPHYITNKITDSNITYINDKDVLDVPDRSFISFRPNWIYQQFLKLFFNQSESEYYFALDADTIITKSLPLFEKEHPIWYYGWKQNHFPYFLFNKKFFNLNKSLDHTGIGDLGLFNKKIIQTFLNYTGTETPLKLLKMIGPKTNVVFHFSEYETYANFCNTYYPDLYVFKHLEQQNSGRDLNQGQDWTQKDIITTIENYKNSNKSILSLHSWKL